MWRHNTDEGLSLFAIMLTLMAALALAALGHMVMGLLLFLGAAIHLVAVVRPRPLPLGATRDMARNGDGSRDIQCRSDAENRHRR